MTSHSSPPTLPHHITSHLISPIPPHHITSHHIPLMSSPSTPPQEYLMRCQWGTTWENMQPWIVARRYREFDVLNFQVTYGNSASVLIVVCTYIVSSHLVLSGLSRTQFIIYIFLPYYPFLFRPHTHFYSLPFLLFSSSISCDATSLPKPV